MATDHPDSKTRYLVPLTAPMVVGFDALGATHRVSPRGHFDLDLILPGIRWDGDDPRPVLPAGFEETPGVEVALTGWQHSTSNARDRTGQALIDHLCFAATLDVRLVTDDDDPDKEVRDGAAERATALEEWVVLFEDWIATSSNQPLDPLRPRRALFSPRSNRIIAWLEDAQGSRLDTTAGTRRQTITVRGPGPLTWHDELVVDASLLAISVDRANQQVEPAIVARLWERALHGFLIGDYRTCLVDLGTMVEAALVESAPQRRKAGTLGGKVARLTRNGVALPANLQRDFVDLRNRVLHDAHYPTRSEASTAGDLALQVVSRVANVVGFARPTTGEPAWRPARSELIMFKPSA